MVSVEKSAVLVLLAEDDSLVATGLVVALEEAGYEVFHANSGAAAIDFLDKRAAEIKALVTDIKLGPGPDGWEVAHHARTLVPTLPVVYTSGDSAEAWAANGVPNSVMLAKPFALAQLVTAVSQLITSVSSTPPPA